MELYALEILFRNVEDVLLVFLADHDVGNAGTLGCQDLLLDASHWEYLAAKGNLARSWLCSCEPCAG